MPNSGGGGGGGTNSILAANSVAGGGGGGGCFIRASVSSPSASYTFGVGTFGTVVQPGQMELSGVSER